MSDAIVQSATIQLKDYGLGADPRYGSKVAANDFYVQPIALDDPNARFISDSTGNDSNDGILIENGGTGPWKTIPAAWAALSPSNVLFYMDMIPLTANLEMKFVGSNSATELTRIAHTRHPDVDIDSAGINFNGFSISKFDQKHWWQFENLTYSDSNMGVGQDITSTGAAWRRMKISMLRNGDNFAGLNFLATADDFILEDITIIGPGYDNGATVHTNTACLWMTRTERATLNRLTLKNAPIPLYFKHANDSIEANVDLVMNNIFIDESDRNPAQLNCNWAKCDNWVIGKNNANAITVSEDNGVAGGDNNILDHFTFYDKTISFNSSTEAPPGAVSNTLTNSVMANSVASKISISDLSITSDNNVFGDTSSAYNVQSVDKNLATWRSESSQDVNSVDGTVIFDGGANPTSINDYALASGSAGFGTDAGADVTLCGSRV